MTLKDYTKAVVALCGYEGWSIKRENGVCEVTWTDDYKGTKYTHKQITDKAEELKVSTAYIDQRKAEYPSIVDQLDDIYHNGIDGWKATIKAVKDKYPKE